MSNISEILNPQNSPDFLEEQLDTKIFSDGSLLKSVDQYLKQFPHIKQESLSSKVVLQECSKLYYYAVDAELLVEHREIARKIVPYQNWAIPPLRKYETNVEPWSYKLPPISISSFQSEGTQIISDSQQLSQCIYCSVQGDLTCENCKETGQVTCSSCSGQKTIACGKCSGRGQVRMTRPIQRTEKCPACSINALVNLAALLDDNPYTRARRCASCGGSGVRIINDTESYDQLCPGCNGQGRVPCRNCRSIGKVVCTLCKGKRRNRCETCLGHKKLVSYLELRRCCEIVKCRKMFVPEDLLQKTFGEKLELLSVDESKVYYKINALSLVDSQDKHITKNIKKGDLPLALANGIEEGKYQDPSASTEMPSAGELKELVDEYWSDDCFPEGDDLNDRSSFLQDPQGHHDTKKEPLLAIAFDALNGVRDQIKANGKVAEEQLLLRRGECIRFKYMHGNISYSAIAKEVNAPNPINRYIIWPHDSPAVQWLNSQLSYIGILTQRGEKREAALVLKKCQEMAEKDAACRRKLTQARIIAIDELRTMAKRVSVSKFQLLGNIFAAILGGLGLILSIVLLSVFPVLFFAFAAGLFYVVPMIVEKLADAE